MKIDIFYDKQAQKFLKRNPHRLTVETSDTLIRRAVKKLDGQTDINIDLKYLRGRSKGKFRIRTGNIRIIFSIERGVVYVVTVEDIGFRGDVFQLRESEAEYHTTRDR